MLKMQAWLYRHSDDIGLWKRLLILDLPDILCLDDPFIYRDLLLALEKNQAYLFHPDTGAEICTSYWFYLDDGQPCITAISAIARGKTYVDDNKSVLDAIHDLLYYPTILLEEGADEIKGVLEKANKNIYLLPEYSRGLYCEISSKLSNFLLVSGDKRYALIVLIKNKSNHIFEYFASTDEEDILRVISSL